jgi:hypothetical protein
MQTTIAPTRQQQLRLQQQTLQQFSDKQPHGAPSTQAPTSAPSLAPTAFIAVNTTGPTAAPSSLPLPDNRLLKTPQRQRFRNLYAQCGPNGNTRTV